MAQWPVFRQTLLGGSGKPLSDTLCGLDVEPPTLRVERHAGGGHLVGRHAPPAEHATLGDARYPRRGHGIIGGHEHLRVPRLTIQPVGRAHAPPSHHRQLTTVVSRVLRNWTIPLTAFAFLAALIGLALSDTWGFSLFAAAAVAAVAGDMYVTRKSRPRPTPRERILGAAATLAATYVMLIPALVVLLLIVYVVLAPF